MKATTASKLLGIPMLTSVGSRRIHGTLAGAMRDFSELVTGNAESMTPAETAIRTVH
jgi:hypothetical protein